MLSYRPFGSFNCTSTSLGASTLSSSEEAPAMKLLATIPMLTLVLFVTVAAQSNNSTGTWDATLTSPQGTFNVQFVLKQDGEKVTGVVKGQRGEIPIEGTLTGKDLKLKYTIKFQDNDMLITLAGTLDGASVKGTADYGGL